MIAATGTIASRHLKTGKDTTGMGHYSYQKFTGNNGTKILFIVAYRVCKEAITTAGEGTSFFHQWHKITRLGHKHLNPRRQILNDLWTIVLQAIGKGTDVCITINANESIDLNNQLFHEWIAECGLVSVHENLYDEDYYEQHPIPSTYQHGGKKINHVFCTPRLFECVTGAAIEPLHDGIFSDHRALIVDFNTAQLLSQTLNIAKPKTRLLTSARKKAMCQYHIELDYRLQAQNIYEEAANYTQGTKPRQHTHKRWKIKLISLTTT
jgi:hypothetical protein